jgi:hypothetical protein
MRRRGRRERRRKKDKVRKKLMGKKGRMFKGKTVSLFYVLYREREGIFCILLVSAGNLCSAGVLSSSAGFLVVYFGSRMRITI